MIYEDENILLCDKPVGMVVHEDNDNTSDTLINRIKCCLWKQGSTTRRASRALFRRCATVSTATPAG